VGAGASGLLLAYKIQRHFGDFELKIFEKNPEVSGTWFENRYPGYVHCRSIRNSSLNYL
jgi:cation diffusion facilitator CzcD-associated flavoprotein CzcO